MPQRVLCFASWFLPGFKSGGPVRSLLNLTTGLGGDIEFRVVTRDRDLGDDRPYPRREPGRWYPESGTLVRYMQPPYWRPGPVRRVIFEWQPDLLYFNSFMDPGLSIAPLAWRACGALPRRIPVLIAPRGEFSPGALGLKSTKKAAFLRIARQLPMYSDVTWHATSEAEAAQLRQWLGKTARIMLAPNLPPTPPPDRASGSVRPRGRLRVVFLSRISRMKNLDAAIRIMQGVYSQVDFDIFGILEDRKYWDECQQLLRCLPPNVTARYRGVLGPQEVFAELSCADLLLLPTRGENFGHVILEALLAGCPVLVSDQTPWRGLESRLAGRDIPLDRLADFSAAIDWFARLPAVDYERWSAGARAVALEYGRRTGVGRMREVLAAAMMTQQAAEER
jgi:glycosyltransferase involved in cell wall biosynthesis